MSAFNNWQEEKCSAYLYKIISEKEVDVVRKKLFLELAVLAERQANIWFKDKPADVEWRYSPSIRVRIVALLIGVLGVKRLRFILSAMKVRGMSTYSSKSSHAEAHLETRHKGINTAGNLRAAVFGISDGLVSNSSLILGVFGASVNQHMIFLSGIAGLLAGAFSMAAGEFVSMRSQKEFFEYQIALEKEELELYPEEEAQELATIYEARGMPKEDAKLLANKIINDPTKALDTLAREELGLNPDELGSPIGAAASSFISFAMGAFIPILPFLSYHFSLNTNAILSMLFTGIALFSVGSMLSLYTNRSGLLGGLRMLTIGGMACLITYIIGHFIGGGL